MERIDEQNKSSIAQYKLLLEQNIVLEITRLLSGISANSICDHSWCSQKTILPMMHPDLPK